MQTPGGKAWTTSKQIKQEIKLLTAFPRNPFILDEDVNQIIKIASFIQKSSFLTFRRSFDTIFDDNCFVDDAAIY